MSDHPLAYMQEALAEARAAGARGEWPVGAVVVRNGAILARAGNEDVATCDPTAHAEVLAIRRACAALGRRKLRDCVLYTTLYPCPMCEMVAREVGLTEVHFGGSPFRWVREVKFGDAAFAPQGPLLEASCRGLFEARLRERGREDILGHERAPVPTRRIE